MIAKVDMDQEEELLARARAGSEAAFADLIRLHQVHVRAYLGGFVRNAEVVDDLAQETFLSAYRSLDSFRGDARLRMWLLGIARNRALMYLRDEERRRQRSSDTLEAAVAAWLSQSATVEPKTPSEHERALSALEKCLEGLPPASAGLVTDYYVRGRSTAQIARQTSKNEAAIWKALSRLRQALRHCIELRIAGVGAE